MHNRLQGLPALTDCEDRLVWKWTPDGVYTAASAYKALFLGQEEFPCGKSHASCPLCDAAQESADHLAVGFPFSRAVWAAILGKCGLTRLVPTCDALEDWWPMARRKATKRLRKGFDSLAILVVWRIWLERNAQVFENSPSWLQDLCTSIANDAHLWKLAGAAGLSTLWR
ncbi:unnamed protein product [Alopecurus aequalis]